jgi:hypothetical protein
MLKRSALVLCVFLVTPLLADVHIYVGDQN